MRAMSRSDLIKYTTPVFINLLKSYIEGVAKPWDWDPFNIFLKNPNPTTTTPPPAWTKLFIHVSLLLILLASASMDVTVARLRAPPLYLLILGSLFLPQALFWYAYAALLAAACLIMTILMPRRSGLHANSTTTATATTDDQSHSSHVPQVAIDVSLQHHDASHAEADDEAILLL